MIKEHKKGFTASILTIVIGMAMKVLSIGETETSSLGGAMIGLGILFLLIVFFTALRTAGRGGKVREDERTKKIYGKAAATSIILALPPAFIFGIYISTNPKIMALLSPVEMLSIPIGFLAVVYLFAYNYYSRKE
ncbi:MAG: DUF2178 domain-containing protein [Candidatus Altiarchaeota archaeon]|nr:DUF2178 domain-containing protein [Candidatus Altiarchaeota archaeon]